MTKKEHMVEMLVLPALFLFFALLAYIDGPSDPIGYGLFVCAGCVWILAKIAIDGDEFLK